MIIIDCVYPGCPEEEYHPHVYMLLSWNKTNNHMETAVCETTVAFLWVLIIVKREKGVELQVDALLQMLGLNFKKWQYLEKNKNIGNLKQF